MRGGQKFFSTPPVAIERAVTRERRGGGARERVGRVGQGGSRGGGRRGRWETGGPGGMQGGGRGGRGGAQGRGKDSLPSVVARAFRGGGLPHHPGRGAARPVAASRPAEPSLALVPP